MDELDWYAISPKMENMEMDYLRDLGIEPNFADVSRHVEDLCEPLSEWIGEQEWASDKLFELEDDNEQLESQVSNLEDKLDSLDTYARRMRRELDKMDFKGKGEIEAILDDIEDELEL